MQSIDIIDRITINAEVCHGKPVIRNMRYPVELFLDLLASGMSVEDILQDYPLIEREDILACLMYAHKLSQVKSIQNIVA